MGPARLLDVSRRRLMAAAALVAALLLGIPPLASWNQMTHRQINFQATKLFFKSAATAKKFKLGPISEAGRTASHRGIAVAGTSLAIKSVVELDYDFFSSYQLREERHSMVEWITLGGDWADEPNLYASVRHFYDPLQVNGVAYLTDQYKVHGVLYDNPATDAVTWALEDPDNPFCLKAGMIAYKHAFETPENFRPPASTGATHFKTDLELNAKDAAEQRSLDLAYAYRALGETMHLIGDMTQPAHVRNDSHPLDEPIEQGTYSEQAILAAAHPLVDPRAQSFLASAGGKLQTPRQLFHRLAVFTNHCFYSMDTIYDEPSGTMPNNFEDLDYADSTGSSLDNFQIGFNMMHPYPFPQFDNLKAHTATIRGFVGTRKVKRLYAEVAGREVPMIQERLSFHWFDPSHSLFDSKEHALTTAGRVIGHLGPYMIPSAFAPEQSAVLLPLAIHACADLMNLFFPTLELKADYRDEGLQPAAGAAAGSERRVITIEPNMVHDQASDPAWKGYDLAIKYTGPGTLVITRGDTVETTRKLQYEEGRLGKIESSDGTMVAPPLQVYVAGGDSPLRGEEAFYAFEFGQKLHLEIDAGSRHFESPSYELQPTLFVEPGIAVGPPGATFDFDAHARPEGNYRFEWSWTGSDGPVITEGSTSTVAPILTEEGEYTFTVKLIYPNGTVLAEDRVFATVEKDDEDEEPAPTPSPYPTPRRETGKWVLADTTLIDGCSFYESECYTLETCSASQGSFDITKSYSSCSCKTCGGDSGSGTYTVPPASLSPGETVILEAHASGDGSCSVYVGFYSTSKGLKFNDHGGASISPDWTRDIARSSSSGGIPMTGEFTVPDDLNKDGVLRIVGGGGLGAFEMSMSYSYLYRWKE